MNGKLLHKLLKDNKINFVELANKLNLTPQALNSKFKTKEVSVKFLQEISEAINKNLYNSIFEDGNEVKEPGEVYQVKNIKKELENYPNF